MEDDGLVEDEETSARENEMVRKANRSTERDSNDSSQVWAFFEQQLSQQFEARRDERERERVSSILTKVGYHERQILFRS